MAHNDSFDEPRFEALYRKLYPDLLRCAEIALRTGGSWYVSVAGRAEEVVQELFAFAWEQRAEITSILTPEEYEILRKLYLEKYTYEELAREMGLKKSALAMRVKRSKERFVKQWNRH